MRELLVTEPLRFSVLVCAPVPTEEESVSSVTNLTKGLIADQFTHEVWRKIAISLKIR
jgi:hypothetical protein